ncbi:MAG: orotidine-5'-phosphate decarboxylase [Bacteroidetes bacterium HGW-Bacteroidetes-21]|nr:MAG: orotidine-5'-phosphate decarboxylase [Bacteroidetes bacterium HGW-Bacteroidetes-21]
MTLEKIFEQIVAKRSFLCVGLDTDINKMPAVLNDKEDSVFEFNKAIVDATAAYTIAYKPNLAFYECMGIKGLQSLGKTVRYIRDNYPDIFLIADAKRGDIGNTSKMYARAFFEEHPFDAVTVAPYMGSDSVTPFLSYSGKFVILLALTSNPGANDFQMCKNEDGVHLYEKVLKESVQWGDEKKIMYVVGATRAEMLTSVRNIVPNHFLLVPGVGAQGGSLSEVAKYGMNKKCGLIVNASRSILYADSSENFANAAAEEAKKMQLEMEALLIEHRIVK